MLGGERVGRGAEFQAVGAPLIYPGQCGDVGYCDPDSGSSGGKGQIALAQKVHQQTTAKVFSHWAKKLVIRRKTSHWANNLITNNTIVVLPPPRQMRSSISHDGALVAESGKLVCHDLPQLLKYRKVLLNGHDTTYPRANQG